MMVSLNQPAIYVSAWGDIQGWLQHCPVLHYVTFYSLLHLDKVVDIYIHTKNHNLLFKIISLKLLLWRSQPCTRRHGRCRQGCAGWVNIFNNPLLIKEYSSFHILFFLCKILNSELPIIEQKLILVFLHRFYYSPLTRSRRWRSPIWQHTPGHWGQGVYCQGSFTRYNFKL